MCFCVQAICVSGLMRHLSVPAARRATRKDESGLLDGKSDFFGFHLPSKAFCDGGVKHIGQNGGLQAGGIGIDQEKQSIF